jgi:hypothetical protein
MPDQRAVTEQLADLIRLANEHGLYDAADWVKRELDSGIAQLDSRIAQKERDLAILRSVIAQRQVPGS